MFRLDLEMAEEPEIKLPTSVGSSKKQESSRKKHLLLLYWLCYSLWLCRSQQTAENSDWEYQTILPAFCEACAGQEEKVAAKHGTTDWFRIGSGVCEGCVLSPCLFDLYAEYVTWNDRLDESQAETKIARRNISNLGCAHDTTLTAEREEEIVPWWGWRSWPKTQHLKMWDHSIMPHHFMANRWENSENSDRLFIFLGSQITVDCDYSHEIKRCLLLGRKALTNRDSILKSRDITLLTKVQIVNTTVFPVVLYECES